GTFARHSFAIFSQPCEIETPGRAPPGPAACGPGRASYGAGEIEQRTCHVRTACWRRSSWRAAMAGSGAVGLFVLWARQADVGVDHLDERIGLHEAFAPLLVPGGRGFGGLYVVERFAFLGSFAYSVARAHQHVVERLERLLVAERPVAGDDLGVRVAV